VYERVLKVVPVNSLVLHDAVIFEKFHWGVSEARNYDRRTVDERRASDTLEYPLIGEIVMIDGINPQDSQVWLKDRWLFERVAIELRPSEFFDYVLELFSYKESQLNVEWASFASPRVGHLRQSDTKDQVIQATPQSASW